MDDPPSRLDAARRYCASGNNRVQRRPTPNTTATGSTKMSALPTIDDDVLRLACDGFEPPDADLRRSPAIPRLRRMYVGPGGHDYPACRPASPRLRRV